MTKAERLAGYLENPESMSHARITMSESAAELRRLAPMEEALASSDMLLISSIESVKTLQARVKELEDALRGLINRYVETINSGDCGNWNPEEETEVIEARKALG